MHYDRLTAALLSVALLTVTGSLILPSIRAHAQTPPVSPPTISLAPSTATVGDRLTLTITVDHDDNIDITGPGFGSDFGGLELIEAAPLAHEQIAAGRARTRLAYTLAAFTSGSYTIPPLALTYTMDGPVSTIETDPSSVTITSVLAPGDTTLRPLKPQLDLDSGAPAPLSPALFVAAFAALTAFGYVLHRRAVATEPYRAITPAVPEPSSPQTSARQSLDSLAAISGDPDQYYARIAVAVRRYLSDRFDFPAYALTRRELDQRMAAAGVERWPARLTANLLTQCDAVQFAAFRPARERREADLTAAYEIIALTAAAAEEHGGGD